MGPLPVTLTGKQYIILAVDFFTKYTKAIAVEEADVQTVVKFIYSNIICRHGVPNEITSDHETEFLNELVREHTISSISVQQHITHKEMDRQNVQIRQSRTFCPKSAKPTILGITILTARFLRFGLSSRNQQNLAHLS